MAKVDANIISLADLLNQLSRQFKNVTLSEQGIESQGFITVITIHNGIGINMCAKLFEILYSSCNNIS